MGVVGIGVEGGFEFERQVRGIGRIVAGLKEGGGIRASAHPQPYREPLFD